MRVLYVSPTAEISGAERSLLALLGGLSSSVQPLVATPPGRLEQAVKELGIGVIPIASTAGSLRLHPTHTPRAVAEMSLSSRVARSGSSPGGRTSTRGLDRVCSTRSA